MHLLPFLLRAQAVLRRHIFAFLAGKSHPTLLRSWPGSTGYQIFVISSQSPPLPPPPLFATICYYSSLFVTIRHYSRLFATIRTIRTIRDYSLFGIRDCSLFAIRVFQTPSSESTIRTPVVDVIGQLIHDVYFGWLSVEPRCNWLGRLKSDRCVWIRL